MECPECAHVDEDAAFEDEDEGAYSCPECDYFWTE